MIPTEKKSQDLLCHLGFPSSGTGGERSAMDSSIQAAPFAEEEAWDGGQDHRHLSSVSQAATGESQGSPCG